MKETRVVILGLLLVLVISLLLSGCCTGIGYVVGQALDHHNATCDSILVENLSNLQIGENVCIRTKEESLLSGPLYDIRNTRRAEYQTRYLNWQIQHQHRLFSPHLGDTLTIARFPDSTQHGGAECGIFMGLTTSSILLEGFKGEGAPYIEGGKSVLLRSVDRVSYSGVNITGDSIQCLLDLRLLPVTTSLVIGVKIDTLNLPWDSVSSLRLISTKTPSTGKTIGIVAGAALDIIALVITIENISKTRTGGRDWLKPF